MMKLTSVVVLCLVVAFIKADICQDNVTISEFPGTIQQEIISIVLTGTIGQFTGCPTNRPVLQSEVKFLLYNRDNRINPITLNPNNPVEVDPSKPIKVLIHGWTCSMNGIRMPEIRKAYLDRYDCNMIGIDWSARSVDLYGASACSVSGVGKIVAEFLCNLSALLSVDLTQQIHVIGHSLGGQVAGYTGQEVQKQCNKLIARITGLDPAGPLFNNNPPSERLDASDAMSVDVIHSNGGFLGYPARCGDIDFYPNCGSFQDGCLSMATPQQILSYPISVVACSHLRACDYLIESIIPVDKIFKATSCATCPGLLAPNSCVKDPFFLATYNIMGEDATSNPSGKFYVKTNSQSPFARG